GDGRRHVLEATRDVTEQRRAEAALRASEARSAILAEASRVLGSSLDYETTLANLALLAVPLVADWCTVDLLDERGELRRLSVAPESGRRFEPDDLAGAEELARRAAVAIENARLYQQAQEAIRVRDDFFAAASHDLKNPLASIRGNAQVLLRTLDRTGGVPLQRLTSALTNVVGSIDQMTRLIDDLLDVARLRLGESLPLDCVATDLVALTRRAVAAQQAATDHHQLALRMPEAELVGEWDVARLERVLGNLLSNAIKYSPNGGEIAVSVRAEAGQAVLTVQDRGIG